MKKIFFFYLLLLSPLCAMKRTPEWTEEDFKYSRELNKTCKKIDDFGDILKKRIKENELKFKQLLSKQEEKVNNINKMLEQIEKLLNKDH